MTIDVDTTLPDPELVASIVNESAQTVASFSVRRSELE